MRHAFTNASLENAFVGMHRCINKSIITSKLCACEHEIAESRDCESFSSFTAESIDPDFIAWTMVRAYEEKS
ncbi:MAG: hypothetical protein Tsb009_03070 [Planctomycetaceae bacterium]